MLPNLPHAVGDTAANARFTGVTARPRDQLRVLAFVNQTPACKDALEYARSFLAGRCSELTLAHCLATHHSADGMRALMTTLAQGFTTYGIPVVSCELLNKTDDQTVPETLADLVAKLKPDLVILGSSALSRSCLTQSSTLGRNTGDGRGLPSPYVSLPALQLGMKSRHSFALKLCQLLRTVPLLLIKSSSRTRRACTQQLQGLPPAPMKCMLDVQPTSRHMLEWVMKVMDPGKDKLYLAVSRAYEGSGARKAASTRMMTAFAVQANSSRFKPTLRYLKDPSGQSLPRCIQEDQVDLLAVQGPRSKELSPSIVEVVCSAAASVLIWPPDTERAAVASRQSDSGIYDVGMPSIGNAPVVLRARALSTDTGFGTRAHSSQEWPPALSPLNERGALQALPFKNQGLENPSMRPSTVLL